MNSVYYKISVPQKQIQKKVTTSKTVLKLTANIEPNHKKSFTDYKRTASFKLLHMKNEKKRIDKCKRRKDKFTNNKEYTQTKETNSDKRVVEGKVKSTAKIKVKYKLFKSIPISKKHNHKKPTLNAMELLKRNKSAIKIQAKYRAYITRKKYLMTINKQKELTICTFNISITANKQNNNSSLKSLKNDTPKAIKRGRESMFDNDKLAVFTLEKHRTPNDLTRMLGMKEKIVLYKEKAERKYLNKMYKSRQYSPQTYYRKRKELEKWVTKEKVDIAQAQSDINNNCNKVLKTIKDAHYDIIRIKKLLNNHALSCNTTFSLNSSLGKSNNLENVLGARGDDVIKESEFALDNSEYKSNEKAIGRKEKKSPIVIPLPVQVNTKNTRVDLIESIINELLDKELSLYVKLNEKRLRECLSNIRKPGIRTDIQQVANYLDEVLTEALKTQKDQFISAMNTPINTNPLNILKKLQGGYVEDSFNEVILEDTVVNLDIYLDIERRKEMTKSDNIGEHEQFIEECEHIHNKSIFDAANEALTARRPYAHPMPWNTKPFKIGRARFNLAEYVQLAMQDVIYWVSFGLGALPRLETFDEKGFLEGREIKMMEVLKQEVKNGEKQWITYEEAEVSIDVADMILDHLVTEFIFLLNLLAIREPQILL